MFHHFVLLELQDPEDPKQVEFMRQQCEYLGAEISAVLQIEFQKNISDRGKEFSHAIIVRFENAQKHNDYQIHPAHFLVKERIKNKVNSLLVLDYETT